MLKTTNADFVKSPRLATLSTGLTEPSRPAPFQPQIVEDLDDPANQNGTITRAHLAEAVHRAIGMPRADAAECVEIVLSEIFESVVSREDVKLSSFGAFHVREKRERLGRNPKTGEEAKICARLVVSFKPSSILRSKINGGPKKSK